MQPYIYLFKKKLTFFSARPEGWKELHTSDILEECENCFTYSQEDICGHHTSDHNFYAVCLFLSRSLWMRNTPEEVRRTHPQLEQLLCECAEPQLEQGRYKAVHKLIPLLGNITRLTWKHAAGILSFYFRLIFLLILPLQNLYSCWELSF